MIGLEERLGIKIDARERIIAFIAEYAAYLRNRLRKGEDGKVAYERIKGKKPTVLGLEFGEKVWFKRRRGPKLEKLKSRWTEGIFVGVRRASNQAMIATELAICMIRDVKRMPIEQRWIRDTCDWINWAPWRQGPGRCGRGRARGSSP